MTVVLSKTHHGDGGSCDLRDRVSQLYTERKLALGAGLGAVPPYMTDLEGGNLRTRELYVGAAVTEIAMLRSELFGVY